MELFDEVKNRYFHIIFNVLNECKEGISKDHILKIVNEEEFQEKVIGKDFQTFEGLLLNEYEDNENFNLIEEENSSYYPNIKGNPKLAVPVRLTNIEKMWLKNLLNEEFIQFVLSDNTILKLKAALKDIEGANTSEIIENTNKSILPDIEDLETYKDNFKILIKAMVNGKVINYCNVDKWGNEYLGKRALPVRIEYSVKDQRFRASMYSLDDNRPIMVNIFSLSHIELEENEKNKLDREAAIRKVHESRYSKEPIVLEVTDKKAAMERCFMSFSEMERCSRCIGEDKYEMKLFYYIFEEEEIIRKILSLGPYVKVISPQRIREEVVKRIRRAIDLNELNSIKKEGEKVIELEGG